MESSPKKKFEDKCEKKFEGLKFLAQEKLQAILCSIPLQKDLIIEPDLIKPMEHICSASWLRSKGIKKMYKFDPQNPSQNENYTRVYLISANVLQLKHVLDQITFYENDSPTISQSGLKKYHIIIVPDVYPSFQYLLEEEGLYGVCELYRFNWNFIKLDDNLLSLEIPNVFNDVFIRHDTSILPSIALSLRTLNILCGMPSMIMSWGSNALKVSEMLMKFEKSRSNQKINDIPTLLIVDRSEDFPSCLLTPAIYSGLLQEVFHCSAGELEIQNNWNKISSKRPTILKVDCDEPKKFKQQKTIIKMNSQLDTIFGDNRFLHFTDASRMIQQEAKALGLQVQNLNEMKIDEIHNYVAKKLPQLTVKKNKIIKHMNACETIIKELGGNFQKQQNLEYDILNGTNRKQILQKVNDILTVDSHKYNSIRLLCLVHQSMKLNSDELTVFVQNYCNIFGYKYLTIFNSLAKGKLLPELETDLPLTPLIKTSNFLGNLPLSKFQQTEFQANANRLKLLTSSTLSLSSLHSGSSTIDNSVKLCPSYVFNGTYIPLIAQIAMLLLKSENIEDMCMKFGSAIDKLHCILPDSSDTTVQNIKKIQQTKNFELDDKFPIQNKLFIFVIGGTNYAEISACDMVSKITGVQIIMGSNYISNGSDLIESANL